MNMKKKVLKFLTMLLSVVLLIAFFPTDSLMVSAETNHTEAEAIEWIRARGNESWWQDVDGAYGCQCVDLIFAYYKYLVGYRVGGNGCDFWTNSLPDGWYRDYTPTPGCIISWKENAYAGDGWYTDGHGHVGLVYAVSDSTVYTVETNIGTGGHSGEYGYSYAKFRSRHPQNMIYIHPNFENQPPSDPTISMNKGKVTIAENITLYFGNISGSSSQYLQISNLTTGKMYYDGYCIGETVHYQSFPQAGDYLVSYQTSNNSGSSNVVTARFLVYDSVPSAPDLSLSADRVIAGNELTIYHWSETANYYSMSIYLNGQVVYHSQDFTGSNTISFSTAGDYKIVCSAINDYGESSYSEAFFEVYNGVPNKPDVWLNIYSILAGNDFTIYHWSGTARWYSMSIYKDGKSVFYTADYTSSVTTRLTEDGKYKIVCSAVNEYGESEYAEVFFEVKIRASDINNDGQLDAGDLLSLTGILLNDSFYSSAEIALCDLNGDGAFNILDMIRLKKLLA